MAWLWWHFGQVGTSSIFQSSHAEGQPPAVLAGRCPPGLFSAPLSDRNKSGCRFVVLLLTLGSPPPRRLSISLCPLETPFQKRIEGPWGDVSLGCTAAHGWTGKLFSLLLFGTTSRWTSGCVNLCPGCKSSIPGGRGERGDPQIVDTGVTVRLWLSGRRVASHPQHPAVSLPAPPAPPPAPHCLSPSTPSARTSAPPSLPQCLQCSQQHPSILPPVPSVPPAP